MALYAFKTKGTNRQADQQWSADRTGWNSTALPSPIIKPKVRRNRFEGERRDLMDNSMQQHHGRKPTITISETDHARLSGLAAAMEDRNPEMSETMNTELDRAHVVRDDALARTIVRMGSIVTYTADGNNSRTVALVYPGEADIAEGRISITTPVGTALIGLKAGQSIGWTARDGRTHKLSVVAVTQQPKS